MQTTPLPSHDGARWRKSPAIAWSAILGGAVAAAAVSILMLFLGSGLGFAFASPLQANHSAIKITSAVVVWLIIMQWVSSGLGGYIAGRMRSRYAAIHDDEVFFRDTAHGFLAWAVATVITAGLLASSLLSGLSGSAHLAAAAGGMSSRPGEMRPMAGPMEAHIYSVDSLFRSDHPSTSENDMDAREEAMRILFSGLKNGDVPAQDRAYLAQVIVAHSGVSPADATKRVNDTIARMQSEEQKAKQAAEAARKSVATLSIFTFLSMLIGAFVGSVAGALGGKRRDEHTLHS